MCGIEKRRVWSKSRNADWSPKVLWNNRETPYHLTQPHYTQYHITTLHTLHYRKQDGWGPLEADFPASIMENQTWKLKNTKVGIPLLMAPHNQRQNPHTVCRMTAGVTKDSSKPQKQHPAEMLVKMVVDCNMHVGAASSTIAEDRLQHDCACTRGSIIVAIL